MLGETYGTWSIYNESFYNNVIHDTEVIPSTGQDNKRTKEKKYSSEKSKLKRKK